MKKKEIINRLKVFWDFNTGKNRMVLEGEYLEEVLQILKSLYPDQDSKEWERIIKENNRNIRAHYFLTNLAAILTKEEIFAYLDLIDAYNNNELDSLKKSIFEEMTGILQKYLSDPSKANWLNYQNVLGKCFEILKGQTPNI